MDRKLLKAIKKFIKESEDDFYYSHAHEVSMMVGTTKCCQGFETEITINFNVVGLENIDKEDDEDGLD
ncbi:MAG: hypothetical protein KAR35_06130 [Candidatus Heimdallarchaeota archaeon]|nr:hypothetical protein [Candidatus Heimdallarchaeota archaeon]MCK5048937.1 hypothetical protein [Candidatus Heimdallarchaeota archaeon]